MARAIQENKAYLGEVDGLIGDGDHGMNMNKGFTSLKTDSWIRRLDLHKDWKSWVPFFLGRSEAPWDRSMAPYSWKWRQPARDFRKITIKDLGDMLNAGLAGLYEIVDARVGDKTLADTLAPAADALCEAAREGTDDKKALELMKHAAIQGRNSTKDMVAKFGRSSRLGERSRGVLDAGATSCCILLCAMADGIWEVCEQEEAM